MFEAAVRKDYPGWVGLRKPARIALIDMAYNLGAAGLRKYVTLRQAVLAGNYQLAANECHRKGVQEERNIKARQMFLRAGGLVA